MIQSASAKPASTSPFAYPRDIGDVRARLRAEGGLYVLVAAEVGVHPGGVGIEGFELAQHRRQDLVLDVDQVDGPAGDVQALRCHGGDRLAEVPRLALGEDGLVHDVQPDPVVELLTCQDGVHPRQALGLGSVDGDDPCPGVRALFDLGIQHSGEHHVARVHGPARQLDGVVGTLHVVANAGREGKGGASDISQFPLCLFGELARDVEHGLDYLLVAGASTKVAFDALFDLGDRRFGVVAQQLPDRHHHARRCNNHTAPRSSARKPPEWRTVRPRRLPPRWSRP